MADTPAQKQKDVRFRQRLLTFAGYKPGKVDGVNGRKTKAAEWTDMIVDTRSMSIIASTTRNISINVIRWLTSE